MAMLNIRDFGALSSPPQPESLNVSQVNRQAIEAAFAKAGPGGTVLVPSDGSFYTLGGAAIANTSNVTFRLEGALVAAPEYDDWPIDGGASNQATYSPFLEFSNAEGLTVAGAAGTRLDLAEATGRGLIDGRGKGWWNREILPSIFGKLRGKRPKLLHIEDSERIVVQNLTMLNSPSFHLLLEDVAQVEVGWVNITVDRKMQRALRARATGGATSDGALGSGLGALEPEDLNTDGIDPSGRDVWVHHTHIENDDDSIAVKPCSSARCKHSACSQDMIFEDSTFTGMGASIGSVPPHNPPNCVRNITFRRIDMPKTGVPRRPPPAPPTARSPPRPPPPPRSRALAGKGVYIKSNPSCERDPGGPPVSATISDIVYEDMSIDQPRWWAIWIGPQQQHEPNTALGEKCALDYPITPHCPTQGCVTFANITLRNIRVTSPLLSPGVLLGNASNPMQNILFDNVTVDHPGSFPYKKDYQCENVVGRATGGSSPQGCLTPGKPKQ